MRIQAIATLTTAATVSFFGFQDPESDPATQSGNSAAIHAETFQNAGSSLKEPDPFENGGTSHASGSPSPVVLAESGDGDIDPVSTGSVELAESAESIELVEPVELADETAVVDTLEADPQETGPSEVNLADNGAFEIVEEVESTGPSIEELGVASTEDPIAQVEDVDALDVTPGLESTTATAAIEPVDSFLPETAPAAVDPEDTGDRKEKNSSALELVLDNDDTPLVGPVNPGAVSGEGITEGTPSVAASVASQLVDSVSEAVNAGVGGPDYEVEGEQQAPTMGQEQDGGGFWLKGARLNEVYQYLARLGGMQYFHNSDLDQANYVVTGHLGDGDPVLQMEELGLMYGITVYTKGSTVYALTPAQIAQLPTKPFQYHLKYLRPNDIEQIKTILQPVLTPGSGTVDYETKTNTLIVIDNEQKIQDIKDVLAEMDQPKDQIAIETRILRITSNSRNRIGVDWSSVLGEGLTFEGVESLNTLFNLPDSDVVTEVVTRLTDQSGRNGFTTASVAALAGWGAGSENSLGLNSDIINGSTSLALSGDPGQSRLSGQARERGFTEGYENSNSTTQNIRSTGSHLVLSPLSLNATLRALNEGGLAQQESSPTLVTEDNEPGIISIIDRIPIIITTVSETTAGQNISEEVRYRVDLDDPTNDPATTREIGITVAVTPTLLPDNTIRMALRPRSAQVVEFVSGQSGNLYPRVNESTVDTIARVPNGHSLLIGGFYEQAESDDSNKVPILGDVPGLNFLFKSTDRSKTNTSLVFVVTPKKYSPVIIEESDRMTRGLHERHVLPRDHNWPDRKNPGVNYEPNLGWTMGNVVNQYPDTPQSNPLHPDHPVNEELWLDGQNGPAGDSGQARAVKPVSNKGQRRGFLKNIFKKRQR